MRDLEAEWFDAARAGDHEAAWAVSDKILTLRDPATRDDPRQPYHLRWVWDGRPIQGRHVLVRCYHGLGDTLQFARFLPVLCPMVASLTVEIQAELLPLFAGMPGRFVAFDLATPLPASECDLEIMELSHALRLPPESVPPSKIATPSRPTSSAIGLCWQAGDWDGERSIPPDSIAPLTAWPCASLQPRPTALAVVNPGGCPRDICSTAALVAGLDLVITVDTMITHLAGSLNRPTWLLLKHDADWRWMRNRRDSPWYPTMCLYRQPTPGDWPGVIARVMADLRRHGPQSQAGACPTAPRSAP